MPKLIQTGYNFRYTATTGGNVIDEEWGIERVAAYMCIVEANRMLSQRYEKYRTYCSRIGMTLYDVEFLDSATKVDLNTLINKFLPEVLDTDNDNIKYLGLPLNTALDALETASTACLGINFQNSGFVTTQWPAPGSKVNAHSRVELTMQGNYRTLKP